tara:strand:+ start:3540 stop:3935 length:396 start_codon:yes stop_codon:yes gene_type:complete
MTSIRDKDIRNFLLSKGSLNRQPLLFTHTRGYFNSRIVSFRRLLLVLVIDMGILNTHKLQNPRNQDIELERKKITLFEEAVKIGEKELKKNKEFYTPVLDNKDGFFYITTKSLDRFITDIVLPLANMIKFN